MLLAAIGLRIWSVAALVDDLRIVRPILDGRYYLALAQRLATGEGWPPGPLFFGPLYPWLVGLLWRIAPHEILTIQIAQSALGVATLLLLLLAVRRLLGPAAGWAAAVLYLLYGPILAMESQVLMATLLLFLVAAALWLWPRAADPWWRHGLFGICCGLLAVGRGSFLLLPLGWAALQLPRGADGTGGRRWWGRLLWVGLGVALALAPQTVHQTRATGHLQVMTLNGGMNLFIGNNPQAQGIFSAPAELDLHEDVTGTRSASQLAGREMSTEEASRFWTARAFEFVRSQPGRAAVLLLKKAALFFSPDEIPQIADVQLLARDAMPLRVAWLRLGWILPLALLGAASRLRRQRAAILPLVLVIAVGWLQTTVFFATGRYRLPITAAFLALAGAGLVDLWTHARRRRWWIVLLTVAAIALYPLIPPGYPRLKARYFDAYQLGKRQAAEGNYEHALVQYERAIAIWPEGGEAWHDRGVAFLRLDRLEDAADAFTQALRRMPRSAVTWYALGAARHQQGRHELAAEALGRAVALSPYNPRYRIDLGRALAAGGRVAEAAQAWREVLRQDPTQQEAQQLLREVGAEGP